ncbi:hypothetical protein BH09GEM1_BH09GEM1_22870 [soil metagenome]
MFSYVIHPARRRVEAHVDAMTSGAELKDGMEALLDDPKFDPTFGILIDLRELVRAPSVSDLAELASFVRLRAVSPDARRAFVTSSPVFYQLALLFTKLTQGTVARYRVFRSTDAAESWLAGGEGKEGEGE